ncbi:MAG: hypothetical protein JST93_27255 [Acidobacteria bacterium]|nr:hypothetical protein [Acidobacteriota bacterium]
MRRISHILALLLVTILVVAGPCPACPTPQPEKSAHDCCPGGKTTKKAPSKDDCPLIAYYLDVTKGGTSTQDLLALWASSSVMDAMDLVVLDSEPMGVRVEPSASPNGRYSYLFLSVFLI